MMIKSVISKIIFKKDPVAYCRQQGVRIGSHCQIMGTVSPFGTEPYLVTIGDHVRINAGVQFVTHDGSVWVLRGLGNSSMNPLNEGDEDLSDIDLFGKIIIGNNVQIGSNAIILPGVCIGDNVIIGAGAIVTKDIPDNSVAAGIPAKVIESVSDYYRKNRSYFVHTKKMTREEKQMYLTNSENSEKIK